MKDFTKQTYNKLLNEALDRVPNTLDKREGSIIMTAIAPAIFEIAGLYINLDQMQRSAYVQTAVGNSLDLLSILGNIKRKKSSYAVRLGEFSEPVPLGSRFSTISGPDSINFRVTAATENPLEYQLTAETAGAIGNVYVGELLPITYFEQLEKATLTDILIPGDDEESDEELRERLIIALNEKPFAGNIAAYRNFVGTLDGVGAVQVYPTWDGGGTVKLSILGADLEPASPTLIKNVKLAVDPPVNEGYGLGMAPIGAKVTVSTPAEVVINVSATVLLAPGYSLGQVKPYVTKTLENYIDSIRADWDKPQTPGATDYNSNVFYTRIIAAIVQAKGVLNATDTTVNGTTKDIILSQTGVLQQIPKLGAVNLVEQL